MYDCGYERKENFGYCDFLTISDDEMMEDEVWQHKTVYKLMISRVEGAKNDVWKWIHDAILSTKFELLKDFGEFGGRNECQNS